MIDVGSLVSSYVVTEDWNVLYVDLFVCSLCYNVLVIWGMQHCMVGSELETY